MNPPLNVGKRTRSAHPLFPSTQAFLWLPGFSGDERPYCTYNEFRDHPGGFDRRRSDFLPLQDENGASYIPPFPVSPETHISWHTNLTPPYPYHPVPVARTLTSDEIEELGERVIRLQRENPDAFPDARDILWNEHKSSVLAALAEMELLPLPTTEAGESGPLRSAS